MAIVYIGASGILGSLVRYVLSLLYNPVSPDAFPWGTLLCNYTGSILLGFITFAAKLRLKPELRNAITVGFIGSFTTFSTFSFETLAMLQHGRIGLACAYILASLWGGLGLALLGCRWGQSFRNGGEQA